MKKQLIPILLAVIFVSLIGSIYLQFNNRSRIIINKSLPPIPTQATSPTNSVWKVYKNTTLGFEIQYPQDWRIEATPDDLGLCQTGSSNPCIDISTNKPSTNNNSQFTNTTLNGVKAIKYSFVSTETGVEGYVIKLLLKTPLYITYCDFGDVSQILATFQPLPLDPTPTKVQWKTYVNKKYGFQFNYPSWYEVDIYMTQPEHGQPAEILRINDVTKDGENDIKTVSDMFLSQPISYNPAYYTPKQKLVIGKNTFDFYEPTTGEIIDMYHFSMGKFTFTAYGENRHLTDPYFDQILGSFKYL